jgi:hypothetical protein
VKQDTSGSFNAFDVFQKLPEFTGFSEEPPTAAVEPTESTGRTTPLHDTPPRHISAGVRLFTLPTGHAQTAYGCWPGYPPYPSYNQHMLPYGHEGIVQQAIPPGYSMLILVANGFGCPSISSRCNL